MDAVLTHQKIAISAADRHKILHHDAH